MRIFLEILAGIITFLLGKYYVGPELQPEMYGMTYGAGVALLIEFISYLYDNSSFLGLYLSCYFKPYQRPELRLSMAYLCRIEVRGKYLLVKSKRITNAYQPVGGVYKYFNPEASTTLTELSAIPDTAIPNDSVSEWDLRLILQERKNLPGFLKWFFSCKQRECDPWREFYEELVAAGILSTRDFPYIHFEKSGEHFEPIHYDNHFRVDTFKYADIYCPKFITQNQINAIRNLTSAPSPEFIWATADEIRNKVTQDGKRIADHSYKIFHTKMLKK